MFVKVEYKKKTPDIFSIDQDSFLIGNSDFCHIRISHPSISRKHLKILKKNESWFASDQGSTNGTFLQGEQLIPGEKVSLEPGVRLRLSQFAFVSLVEEADQFIPMRKILNEKKIELETDPKSKTQIINMPQFQEQRALAVARRKKSKKEKEILEKKEKRQALSTKLKFFFLLSVIIYVSHLLNELFYEETKEMRGQNVVKTIQSDYEKSIKSLSPFKISQKSLLSHEELSKNLNKGKCLDEKYQEFCTNDPVYFNVYEYDLLKIIFLVDEKYVSENISSSLEERLGEDLFQKVLFLELLKTQEQKLSFSSGKDIYLVFYKENELNQKSLDFVMAFSQIYTDNILSKYDPNRLNQVDEAKEMLGKLEKYFSHY